MSRNGGRFSLSAGDRPPNFFAKTLLGGLAAVALSVILEYPFVYILRPFENLYGAIIAAAILAPVVEETIKAFSAIRIVKRIHPDSGFFVGLRFGIVETFFYVFGYGQNPEQRALIALLRAFISIPLHAACTSMFLYALYVRSKNRGDRLNRVISAYLIHGLFNFSLTVV